MADLYSSDIKARMYLEFNFGWWMQRGRGSMTTYFLTKLYLVQTSEIITQDRKTYNTALLKDT
jgi:hypothetical protein